MAHEKEIIRNTSIFTIARYSAYFFTILTGLIIAKVLGPASFGVYSALMLIVAYSQYSHFGLLFAMTKKVPFYRGKKQYSKVKETENIVFSGTMIIILFLSLVLIIASFFIRNVSVDTINGLRIIAGIVILQQIFYFYQHYLRAEKKFSVMGKSLLVYSITYFIFILFFIFRLKLEGVFLSMFLAYFTVMIYFFRKGGFRVKIIIPNKILNLIKVGFPLLTMGIITLFFISIDKIMIIKFMDKLQLGYYSFAAIVAGIVGFIPQSIGNITFPYLVERYGEKEDKAHIKNYLFQPTLILSYLMPIVIGLVFITAPVAIYYILPKYLPGIIPFKILICAAFFMSIALPASNFLITINKERKIILFQAISVILAIILNYIFIINGYGINGVAIATAISYLFYTLGIMIYSFNHYINNKFIDYAKFFAEIYIPFIYTILILALSNLMPITGNLLRDILLTVLKLAVFLVLSIPLIWLANKKTGVIKIFLSLVFKRRGGSHD